MLYPQAGCQLFARDPGPFAAAERAESPCPPRIPIPGRGEPAHVVAGHALLAFRVIRRTEGRILGAEAALVARLHRGGAAPAFGFSSFQDFAREALGITPRTASRRLALHAALQEAPLLADAFDKGELTTCQVLELRLAARGSAAPFWIELAQNVTVQELRRRIREEMAREQGAREEEDTPTDGSADPADGPGSPDSADSVGSADSADSDPAGRTVTFAAPAAAALAWEHALETARRVLGYEAPVHECVSALLAEAHPALPRAWPSSMGAENSPRPGDDPPGGTRGSPRQRNASPGGTRSAPGAPPPPERLLEPLRLTLALIERELQELEWLRHTLGREARRPKPGTGPTPQNQGTHPHGDPHPRARKVPHDASEKPHDPGASPNGFSGHRLTPDQAHDLVERFHELNHAPRALRLLTGRLLRDLHATKAITALGCRSLREFAETYLGLSERVAHGLLAEAVLFDDEPILAHAYETGAVSLSQAFLIRRLALPDTLRAFILRAGQVTTAYFGREVRFLERLRELLPDFRCVAGPLPHADLDGALVQALRHEGWDDLSLAAHLAAHGLPAEDPGDDPAENPLVFRRLETLVELLVLTREQGGRTSPHDTTTGYGRDLHTVASDSRLTTLHFWLPCPVADLWDDAIRRLRAGPDPLPTWAAAMLLVQHAVTEWERVDPTRIPTEHRILERDGYRCRVPGCTSRRNLEGHHIVHRSQGGPDDPWNRVTLCHNHHLYAVHGPGTVRVTGRAPGGLTWDLGKGRGKKPWRTYRGEKIVK